MASVIGMEPSSSAARVAIPDHRRRSRETSPFPLAAKSAGSLCSLIEGEIIPRMMATHVVDIGRPPVAVHAADDFAPEPAADSAAVLSEDVDAFAPLALALEADALLGVAERLLRRGVSVDTLLIDLLAPTARRLGEYWEEDRCDFVDVTMGLWRLQEVVRHLVGDPERSRRPGRRRAVFATMPGDHHSFGTVIIDEIFRHEGWNTLRIGDADSMELIGRVASDWFDLIGVTVTREAHVPQLRALISAMRNVSRNPHACVMVGGRIFIDNPDLASNVGADGTAPDARAAAAVAARLVDARESGSMSAG